MCERRRRKKIEMVERGSREGEIVGCVFERQETTYDVAKGDWSSEVCFPDVWWLGVWEGRKGGGVGRGFGGHGAGAGVGWGLVTDGSCQGGVGTTRQSRAR